VQTHRGADFIVDSSQRFDHVILRTSRARLSRTNLNWSTAPDESRRIAEAVAKLPPDQLARVRRWFTAFEAGRTDHAEELDSTATTLGRRAARAFA
jgi:hypothetical protein